MRYEGAVYRPPSEAGSLILQTTIGCSYNQCTFCVSFMEKKFREREMDEIIADIKEASVQIRGVTRVFLADGNAMVMGTSKLLQILAELYKAFPMLERVGIYATPQDMLEKSAEDLVKLKEAGLSIVYLGVESGNEEILKWIKKGATRAEVIEAGRKCKESGITLSVTVINGLGGRDKMAEHAYDTATILNEIDPDYIGLLTVMVCQGTPLARQVDKGLYQVPDALEILHEIEMMIKPLELTNCVFRCNHASNYLPLKGTLPQDKGKLLKALSAVNKSGDKSNLRPEYLRGL